MHTYLCDFKLSLSRTGSRMGSITGIGPSGGHVTAGACWIMRRYVEDRRGRNRRKFSEPTIGTETSVFGFSLRSQNLWRRAAENKHG